MFTSFCGAVRRLELLLACASLLFASLCKADIVVAPTTPLWQQLGFNAQHTSLSEATGPILPTTGLSWLYSSAQAVGTYPVVDVSGNVFVVTAGGTLMAFTPSGVLIWSVIIAAGGVEGGPALSSSGSIIVVATKNSRVLGVDAATGVTVWTHVHSAQFFSSPTITPTGNVFVRAKDGMLLKLDVLSGVVDWSRASMGTYSSQVAVSTDGTALYVVVSGVLCAYSTLDSTSPLLWSALSGISSTAVPVLSSGGVVYVTDYAWVYGINAINGMTDFALDLAGTFPLDAISGKSSLCHCNTAVSRRSPHMP